MKIFVNYGTSLNFFTVLIIVFLLFFILHLSPSRELLADDDRFAVPAIIPELSTKRVLTAELIHGLPLDHCTHLPQNIKNDVRMTSSI